MKYYILLHIMLLIYSTSGIFSKMAAGYFMGSSAFFACYAGMMVVLFIYAIGWQQVIKHMPLSVAFASRPVTIVWGMMWGYYVFGERITVMNIIGALVIVLGIEVYLCGNKVSGHE
ncbi:transporter [uncultured Anaerovibrio sp.]|uniref:transporter n=1 Tax=uncultured Anaerovibrio sp. TaxID=361586 RepID=UPI0025D058CB|nr:transporter [uncultured Anaerovibrio sp.]